MNRAIIAAVAASAMLAVDVDLDVVDSSTCDAIDSEGTLQEDECLASLLDIEGNAWVSLGLGTAAAHHFNFAPPTFREARPIRSLRASPGMR